MKKYLDITLPGENPVQHTLRFIHGGGEDGAPIDTGYIIPIRFNRNSMLFVENPIKVEASTTLLDGFFFLVEDPEKFPLQSGSYVLEVVEGGYEHIILSDLSRALLTHSNYCRKARLTMP